MQVYKWHHTASWEFLVFCALRLGVSLTAVGGLFVQMLCHVAWQYVYYCLRALPCLCAKIHAHSGKLNTSAECEWGVLRQNSGFLVQISRHAAWQIISYSGQAYKKRQLALSFAGTLMGNRTPDSAVRGRRLNRLTMRAYLSLPCDDIINRTTMQADESYFSNNLQEAVKARDIPWRI